MSYDLMLQISPDNITDALLQALRMRVNASSVLGSCEPYFHDSTVPAWGDPDDLEDAFAESGTSRKEYLTFCQARALEPDTNLAAGRFFEHLWGVPVLTIHLSSRDTTLVQAAFQECRTIAKDLQLQLYDPQYGKALPNDYSAPLPPQF